MLIIKVILCGRDTKSKLKGHVCSVSNCTCIEELEKGLFITVEWPRVAGSRKCHARASRLKACVAHAAILRGKYHNHAWPKQKIPHVCEVISGLYCKCSCTCLHDYYTRVKWFLIPICVSKSSNITCTHTIDAIVQTIQALAKSHVMIDGSIKHAAAIQPHCYYTCISRNITRTQTVAM